MAKRSRSETPPEDVTVRLEANLGSLLATYGSPRDGLAERESLGDRAREAEEEARRLRAENDDLRSNRAWLLAELDTQAAPSSSEIPSEEPPQRDDRELLTAQADLAAALDRIEALKRSEAHLKVRLEAAQHEDLARSLRKKEDPEEKKPEEMKPEIRAAASKAAEDATQETLRLRRCLREAEDKITRLERDAKSRDSKSSREAAAEERVRALEKCLETMVQGNADTDPMREELESLRFERDEWLRHFPASTEDEEPSQCARRALERLRTAEKLAVDMKVDLMEARAEAKAAVKRADAAQDALSNLEAQRRTEDRDLATTMRRNDLLEAMRSVDQREINSLRLLVDKATLQDDDVDSLMTDARKVLDDARSAVADFLQHKEAPSSQEEEEEESRIVHLAHDNPLDVALREKHARTPSDPAGIDTSKLHARLKERFRQQLTWFREAVYLLTGYKIDMTSQDTDDDDTSTVRLRSMFAEHPDDALLFQWNSDGVQLLETPFATGLDDRLFASLTYCNSVPAFLATVQLDLFDKSTLMPSS